jgi:arsenite-transporting ATPase
MTMDEGGVGKTTVAAALALALADRGHDVTLSTTDPAAHLADALAGDAHARVRVERIDPVAERDRYAEEVLAAAGNLDPEGAALLAEDLRSPCIEEVAVSRAFARTVDERSDRIAILDTAPTGHTLLLLDAADGYQREIERSNAQVPDSVRLLAKRLRDPDYAHILILTLAQATPVSESECLQADLQRAGIEPQAWIVNSSLQGLTTENLILDGRKHSQRPHLDRIQQLSAGGVWLIPWQQNPPVGGAAARSPSERRPIAASTVTNFLTRHTAARSRRTGRSACGSGLAGSPAATSAPVYRAISRSGRSASCSV